MDPIVTTALVGTARQAQANFATGTPTDALLARLPDGEVERKLLLSAGAWAIYRQAGQKAQQISAVPEPAPSETLRACSPGAALLLARLLNGEQTDLLPEALERLRAAGMHLPHNLLPLALDKTNKEQRAALFPVLGERGLWLSQFNPAWKWVRDFLPADQSGWPAEAETIWQEGTTGQRVEILHRLRAVDPDKARAWLEAVWKQEKAEVRSDLLSTLEIGLGSADEAFLEKALDDRAVSVRTVAITLLACLPHSAFSARMRVRGSAMLKMGQGRLSLKLPAALEKDWLRDGIIEKPPSKFGKRAWWLIQALALIPLSFWETQFGMGADELLGLVAEDKWAVNIVDGWSKAAVSFESPGWITPLWNWWREHSRQLGNESLTDYTIREQLLKRMPSEEAEKLVLALLGEKQSDPEDHWAELLPELPRPWSVDFGRACLHIFQHHFAAQRRESQHFNPYANPWFNSLSAIALALPKACLAEALQSEYLGDLPAEEETWQVTQMRQLQQAFFEIIQMRQKLYEEIL